MPKKPGPMAQHVFQQLGDVGAISEADRRSADSFTRDMNEAAKKAGIPAAVRKAAKRGM